MIRLSSTAGIIKGKRWRLLCDYVDPTLQCHYFPKSRKFVTFNFLPNGAIMPVYFLPFFGIHEDVVGRTFTNVYCRLRPCDSLFSPLNMRKLHLNTAAVIIRWSFLVL